MIFKFVQPVLPITAGLFVLAAILLRGEGGPCASIAILILPVLLLGVLVGLVLSVARSVAYLRQRHGSSRDSKL
jgi:hypothetical protein